MIFNFAVAKATRLSAGLNPPASGWLSSASTANRIVPTGQAQVKRADSGIYGVLVSGEVARGHWF